MRKLGYTYLFWVAFAFFNIGFLFPLVFPPILILTGSSFLKFTHFLLPVAISAGLITGLFIYLTNAKINAGTAMYTLLTNAIFLLAFIGCAEGYKNHLIQKSLESHNPECVQSNSFLSSLKHAGREFQFKEHALFVEGGKTFFWSYRERNFFEGQDSLSKNFPCQKTK